MSRRFTVYGSLQLSYERRWGGGASKRPTQVEFIKSLDLGVRGFVVDPRLMNFDISGIIADESRRNFGRSSTLLGVNVDVMLLQTLPGKWMRHWMFIPNPIILRYSRLSDSYDVTNYGITLSYRMPEEVRPMQRNGRRGGFPFPVIVFDYDHYDYKDDAGYRSTSNLYSIRSSLTGQTYDYRFLAERWTQKGDTVSKRDTVELQPNYRFSDPVTNSTWDILNLLRYDKINDTKGYQGRSLVLYRRPMGNLGSDLFLVTGNLNAVRASSADGLSTTAYGASVRAEYDMRRWAGMTVAPFTEIGYARETGEEADHEESAHYERVGGRVDAELSRIFRNRTEVFAGNGEGGLEYGFNTAFSTKTRIRASAGYALTNTSTSNGKITIQQFVLRASGPLFGTLSFDSWADYTTRNTSGGTDNAMTNPFFGGPCAGINCTEVIPSEKSLRAAANLYWSFGSTSVSAGGSWIRSTVKNAWPETVTTSTLQASLSRVLARRTFLNIFSMWIRDSRKNETFEILPRLSWSRGRTTVNVDYDYRSTSTLGHKAVAEHRFFVRVVRSFVHDFGL